MQDGFAPGGEAPGTDGSVKAARPAIGIIGCIKTVDQDRCSNQAMQDGTAPGGDAPGTDVSVKAVNRGTSGVEASDTIGCIKAANHDKPFFKPLFKANIQDFPYNLDHVKAKIQAEPPLTPNPVALDTVDAKAGNCARDQAATMRELARFDHAIKRNTRNSERIDKQLKHTSGLCSEHVATLQRERTSCWLAIRGLREDRTKVLERGKLPQRV